MSRSFLFRYRFIGVERYKRLLTIAFRVQELLLTNIDLRGSSVHFGWGSTEIRRTRFTDHIDLHFTTQEKKVQEASPNSEIGASKNNAENRLRRGKPTSLSERQKQALLNLLPKRLGPCAI